MLAKGRKENVVGMLDYGNAGSSDLTSDADGKPGAGEGMTLHRGGRETQLAAQKADVILEELLERLEQAEAHLIGETTHIVMGFDDVLTPGRLQASPSRFHSIGIDGSLC